MNGDPMAQPGSQSPFWSLLAVSGKLIHSSINVSDIPSPFRKSNLLWLRIKLEKLAVAIPCLDLPAYYN